MANNRFTVEEAAFLAAADEKIDYRNLLTAKLSELQSTTQTLEKKRNAIKLRPELARFLEDSKDSPVDPLTSNAQNLINEIDANNPDTNDIDYANNNTLQSFTKTIKNLIAETDKITQNITAKLARAQQNSEEQKIYAQALLHAKQTFASIIKLMENPADDRYIEHYIAIAENGRVFTPNNRENYEKIPLEHLSFKFMRLVGNLLLMFLACAAVYHFSLPYITHNVIEYIELSALCYLAISVCTIPEGLALLVLPFFAIYQLAKTMTVESTLLRADKHWDRFFPSCMHHSPNVHDDNTKKTYIKNALAAFTVHNTRAHNNQPGNLHLHVEGDNSNDAYSSARDRMQKLPGCG